MPVPTSASRKYVGHLKGTYSIAQRTLRNALWGARWERNPKGRDICIYTLLCNRS